MYTDITKRYRSFVNENNILVTTSNVHDDKTCENVTDLTLT